MLLLTIGIIAWYLSGSLGTLWILRRNSDIMYSDLLPIFGLCGLVGPLAVGICLLSELPLHLNDRVFLRRRN